MGDALDVLPLGAILPVLDDLHDRHVAFALDADVARVGLEEELGVGRRVRTTEDGEASDLLLEI